MLSLAFFLSAVCTHFAIFSAFFPISYSNKHSITYVSLINHAVISVSLGFALSKKIFYQNGKKLGKYSISNTSFSFFSWEISDQIALIFQLLIIFTFPILSDPLLIAWINYKYPEPKSISFNL